MSRHTMAAATDLLGEHAITAAHRNDYETARWRMSKVFKYQIAHAHGRPIPPLSGRLK